MPKKFAILTLCFYGTRTLDRMLLNTGAYVDKIYLSHSPLPWLNVATGLRPDQKSDFDPEVVPNLPYAEKIHFLTGIWDSEEAQRQHAMDQARIDGIDYLIIQDADEFYSVDEFSKNLGGIALNPNFPAYTCPWTVFWKSKDYVIEMRSSSDGSPTTVAKCPNFAVNVNWPGIRFTKARLVNEINRAFKLDGLCLHFAWVLSDEEVTVKVSTWAHSHQFNVKKWLQHKWFGWQPQTRSIGHITRYNYLRAVRFTGSLPLEAASIPTPDQNYRRLNSFARVESACLDALSMLRTLLSETKHEFSARISGKGKRP